MYREKIIGVVVPAYKEEKLIGRTVTTMPDFVDHIIVVDDCSPDRTSEVVRELGEKDSRVVLLRHEQNQGVGGAISTGYVWCRDNDVDVAVSPMEPDGFEGRREESCAFGGLGALLTRLQDEVQTHDGRRRHPRRDPDGLDMIRVRQGQCGRRPGHRQQDAQDPQRGVEESTLGGFGSGQLRLVRRPEVRDPGIEGGCTESLHGRGAVGVEIRFLFLQGREARIRNGEGTGGSASHEGDGEDCQADHLEVSHAAGFD